MAKKYFRFSLRSLFIVLTVSCVAIGPLGRILYFRQQAASHHRYVEQQLKRANAAALDFPAKRSDAYLKNAQQHLIFANACDYASFHPWLSIADAHEIISRPYDEKGNTTFDFR
jgi:hypothetical protein